MKNILSPQAAQNKQAADRIWPASHSFLLAFTQVPVLC